MIPTNITELGWWPFLAIAGAPCLILLFRTLAVVVIARCVKTDVAKMAIPLVLRPVRPSLFPFRRTANAASGEAGKREGDESRFRQAGKSGRLKDAELETKA